MSLDKFIEDIRLMIAQGFYWTKKGPIEIEHFAENQFTVDLKDGNKFLIKVVKL